MHDWPCNDQALKGRRPSDRLLVRAFQQLVEAATGLHFPLEREAEFLEGLDHTRKGLDLEDLPALFQYLEEEAPGGPGWRRLGLELTTGESYFFRDWGQMALIRDVLLEDLRKRSGDPVYLWSAGCSRGEEVYSLAILAHMALPGRTVSILGTDINPWALDSAREGWYSPWSLRGMDPELQERWFLPERDGFRVRPALRERVAFREHNLLRDPMGILSKGQGFDLILCRNVFIYFQPRRVKEVIQAFRRSLKPRGALMLGHGEWGLERPEGMSLEVHPHSVVMRPDDLPLPQILRPQPIPRPSTPMFPPPILPPQPRSLENRLRDVKALADRGQWDAALSQGQELLNDHPLSARTHHLLALILAERRELEASLFMLDKALYLDPHLMAAHLDRARHLESLGVFPRAARAWASALIALDSLPEDISLEELGASSRPELREYLTAALRRCENQEPSP